MNACSTPQALSVFAELARAYYGKNGFGGETAEIYVYRLRPNSPADPGADVPGSFAHVDWLGSHMQAARDLQDIIGVFLQEFEDAKIEIDGRPGFPVPVSYHRWHVTVRSTKR